MKILILMGFGIIGAILISVVAVKIDEEKSLKWAFLGAFLTYIIGYIIATIISYL